VRKRTRAREIALQGLYQLDMQGPAAAGQVQVFVRERAGPDPDLHGFASRLLRGTSERTEEIDGIIRQAAENWNLERMACIDRNIMRMAIYEMLYEPDIPAKVSINEAIEMGKRFSTGQSGAFINGILDRIRRERDL
jgi:transcription antitermination factor NusB